MVEKQNVRFQINPLHCEKRTWRSKSIQHCIASLFLHSTLYRVTPEGRQIPNVMRILKYSVEIYLGHLRGERQSGPASSISLTEVKHGCVRSETGWATFQMNDENSSLHRPSERPLT